VVNLTLGQEIFYYMFLRRFSKIDITTAGWKLAIYKVATEFLVTGSRKLVIQRITFVYNNIILIIFDHENVLMVISLNTMKYMIQNVFTRVNVDVPRDEYKLHDVTMPTDNVTKKSVTQISDRSPAKRLCFHNKNKVVITAI